MDKKTSAEDDFLGDLANNDSDVLNGESEDLFPMGEESTVKEVAEDASKRIPYFKDEKVQKFIQKQIEKGLEKYKPTATETFQQDVAQSEPKFIASLTRIIGTDTPEKIQAIKDLKEDWNGLSKQARQEAIQELMQAQQTAEQQETQQIEEAKNEIEEGFDDIESTYNITLNDRQKDAFKQFLLRIEPRGGYEEYPDFVETFDIFRNSLKRSNSQAKTLASRGMERSSSADNIRPLTSNKGESLWKQVDRILPT